MSLHSMPPPRGDLDPAAYVEVGRFLVESGLGSAPLMEALAIRSIGDLGKVDWSEARLSELPPATATVARLFLQGASIPGPELLACLGSDRVDLLQRIGLLCVDPGRPGCIMSPVLLYAVEGRWTASDRVVDTEGKPLQMGSDAVFPGLYPGTLRFLRLLPPSRGTVLDVCGGCGIGAMVAARTARSVTSSDITRRADAFARFNLLLNAVTNSRSVVAAGYEGVVGETFDLIVGHPPYVPSLGDGAVFRDGGSLGEDIVRTLIEDLPRQLAPGGQALFLSFGRSTHTQRWEERLRGWLGADASRFDLLLGWFDRKEPGEIARDLAERADPKDPDLGNRLEAHFRAHDTKDFVYGAIYLAWSPAGLEPLTEVVELSVEARGSDLVERMEWARIRAREDHPDCLGEERLRMRTGVELHSRHGLGEGGWEPAECLLRSVTPIPATLRVDPGMVPVLGLLDGTRTAAGIHALALGRGLIPEEVPIEGWLGMVSSLMDRGFLQFATGTEPAGERVVPA